jgi:hypothetical protein
MDTRQEEEIPKEHIQRIIVLLMEYRKKFVNSETMKDQDPRKVLVIKEILATNAASINDLFNRPHMFIRDPDDHDFNQLLTSLNEVVDHNNPRYLTMIPYYAHMFYVDYPLTLDPEHAARLASGK